ncbi:VOC family protein [Flavobacterium sp.]|uniref:VOC family protein n=1 Tax=Flavobacterium sp. TaxID=239 RepID=UPI00260657FE|nr:VOC family protein [Flavobacterium sp.]
MKKPIYPCLWFDGQAKEAAEFYCTVFPNSTSKEENSFVALFESAGQKFMCLNGGPNFKINPSISFFVVCETEEELDSIWSKLLEGGPILMALDKYPWSEKYGWIQDKFGVNWQLSFGKLADVGQKFTPALMFTQNQHGNAEKAVNFYTSVFENSSIRGILKYDDNEPVEAGKVKHAQFQLDKTVFMAMDGGMAHDFKFNEAVSFVVSCKDQAEVDYYWDKLTEGGEESMCGWLKDQFGVSWQIVPEILEELMSDPERFPRVMQAFMQMKKFDIATLLKA